MTTKTLVALFASASLLAGGAAASARDKNAETQSTVAAQATTPQMHFGEWGVDLTQIDPAIRPGDDFNAYVNSKWVKANPIPPEFSRYGAFTMLSEKSQADVKSLMDELLASKEPDSALDAELVDAYKAYMNRGAINKAGIGPARPWLNAIQEAQGLGGLSELFGAPGIPSPIDFAVTIDDKDPDSYIIGMGTGGLGLPDRDYYLKTDEKSQAIQTKYRAYLAFVLGKAGFSDPTDAAGQVYDLEYRFAELAWDRTLERNVDLIYNKVSKAKLLELAGDYPLEPMLDKSGLGHVQQFIVWQLPPDEAKAKALGLDANQLAEIGGGLPAMFRLLEQTPPAIIKAWAVAHFVSGNAGVLPADIDDARFAFYGKVLNGQEEQRPRWKRAIDTVEGEMGEALGEAYVARHFPPSSKEAMLDLIANLRKALAESLAQNDWMSDTTRKEAVAKLDQFTAKIGYPDKFKTYDGLVMTADKPLQNAMEAARWSWNDDVQKLGKPVDRTEWYMLPQTVNAYYNPSSNEIVFPAAILQPPFFDPNADMAVNYGGIGAVIGHEIGHGFDDQGAKYDGTGLMRDWWSPDDLAAFSALGEKLVAQYNRFCPLDSGETCVNGQLTLGENIGDLGGLSLAYRAYRMALNGKEAPIIDGLTGDQRFFLSWAQVWRMAQRDESLRQQLLTDPHSPAQYRVNGIVRNMDAWYKAFNVQPGDKLYLPPEERIHIW
ncbi:MAG: M13 family metallopeptidase [Novosphingobium sp.]|nr:M13 family metallopeptidase [Novosphingobium sp.]